MTALPELMHLDLGSNHDNLCYNHSTISSKVKLGIAPCDKNGMPILHSPAKDSDDSGWRPRGSSGDRGDDGSSGDEVLDDSSRDDDEKKQEKWNEGYFRMRSIKRLPEAVRSSVRSGVVVFDLTRVVEELVFNSLDAGATKVSIALGVGTCCIKVADNGYGITRDGLVLLGERYATSKSELMAGTDTVNGSFGFRGEALGSISDVSLLEIVTKAHGMPNGYRKVIKGCKCLYIGIDDDRQDVGTTVIVRDLFYNQPVRRKHLQSSPKKILHSVRETVLRIALVHLKVSFKVTDMESGEELLCTHPSTSPLALLMSGLRVEVSSSLHSLDVSDCLFRLSGYVSGPSLTFSVKAVQYFYINSRFISKGPIHKLLNQVAARFNYLNVVKDNIEFQKGNQSRSQTYRTYILNLRCPRALYDLTFEPSKTTVEFKDWNCVLGFIENAISHFWSQKISHVQEDSLIYAADMSSKEVISEEAAHILPTTEDLPANEGILEKRYMSQARPDCLGFLVSKESRDLSAWSNCRFSCGISSETGFQPEGHQTRCGATVPQESVSHVEVPGRYVSSAEDYYYQNEFTRERPNEGVDCLSPSRWDGVAVKINSSKSDGLSGDYFKIANDAEKVDEDLKRRFLRSCSSPVSLRPDGSCFTYFKGTEFQADGFRKKKQRVCSDDWDHIEEVNDIEHDIKPEIDSNEVNVLSGDCFRIVNDVEKDDEYFKKPSVRSWSSHVSLLPDGACFANLERSEFQADGFRKKMQVHNDDWDDIGEVNDIEQSIEPKFDSNKCNGLSGDYFEIADDVQKVDDNLKKPSLRSCSARASLLPDGTCFANFEGMEFRKKKRLHRDVWHDIGEVNNIEQGTEPWQDVATTVQSSSSITTICDTNIGLLSEDRFTITGKCPDPVSPVRRSGYRSCAFDSEWYSLSPDPKFIRKMPDIKHFIDEDVSGWDFKYLKTAGSDYMSATARKDDILSLDSSQIGSGQYAFPLPGYIHFSPAPMACTSGWGDINFFHEDDILCPENSGNFLDETEGLKFDSLDEGEKNKHEAASSHRSSLSYLDEERIRRHQISLTEKMHCRERRSKRSCSAPPFHKGRKKFFALSNWPNTETRKSDFETIHGTPTFQEPSDLKHIKESSSIDPLSLNVIDDSLSNARKDIKTTADITEILNGEMQDQCFDIYNTGLIEDFTSKEAEITLDSGPKWRNSCPTTTVENGEKSDFLPTQDSILNISSGIFHLSGDLLVPKSISKKFLENAKVLQQVDRKFIPLVSGGTLAIIDQHAADERIRLEELRQKVLSGKMKTITHLETEQELVLPEIGYQLLHNYGEQIQKWGWICNFHSQSSKSFKRNLNILHRQPSVATLLTVPCILGVNLTDVDLLEFLQQLADTDGSSTIPQAVLRVLNFKACRGAIMFGDKLLPSECSLIVEELKQTSLCFQCAHGRPTTVPLVDMNALHKQIAKLEMLSRGSVEPWHGLHRHKLSLERAAQRLNSD